MTARLRFISASGLNRRECLTRLFGRDEASYTRVPATLTEIERAHPFAKNAKEWGTHLLFSCRCDLGDGRSERGILIGGSTGIATLDECQSVDHCSAGTAERSRQGGQGLPFIFVRIVDLHSGDVAGSVIASKDVELAVQSDACGIDYSGRHVG